MTSPVKTSLSFQNGSCILKYWQVQTRQVFAQTVTYYVATACVLCRYEIMKSCWKVIPEDRPRFSVLVKQLNQQQPEKSQSTAADHI